MCSDCSIVRMENTLEIKPQEISLSYQLRLADTRMDPKYSGSRCQDPIKRFAQGDNVSVDIVSMKLSKYKQF